MSQNGNGEHSYDRVYERASAGRYAVKSLERFLTSPLEHNALHMEVYGSGSETLVFIPGLGGTTRYWRPYIEDFQARYRVVLIDLLGFGQSPKPWVRYDVECHVASLREVLKPLGPVSLIGHSLGALIMTAYAARYQDEVKNLVAISMPYFGSKERAYAYFRQGSVKGGYFYTNLLLTIATCIFTRRLLGWLLPYIVRSVPREIVEDLVKHTWRSSTSSLWEVVYGYDVAVDLERLPSQIDVLFVHGEQDLMAPLSGIEQLLADRQRWRLFSLPQVDHHPLLRDPARCLSLIDETLADTIPLDNVI